MRRFAVISIFMVFCLVAVISAAWAQDGFLWPVGGEVLKSFDPREHRGIDVSANVGDSVLASQNGVVYWIGKTPRGEPCISIDHPGGFTTTYLPVRASVSKGQEVKAGDIIGSLSSEIDSSSERTHLHFGVFESSSRDYSSKKYLDPSGLLIGGVEGGGKAATENEVFAAEVTSGSGVLSDIDVAAESNEVLSVAQLPSDIASDAGVAIVGVTTSQEAIMLGDVGALVIADAGKVQPVLKFESDGIVSTESLSIAETGFSGQIEKWAVSEIVHTGNYAPEGGLVNLRQESIPEQTAAKELYPTPPASSVSVPLMAGVNTGERQVGSGDIAGRARMGISTIGSHSSATSHTHKAQTALNASLANANPFVVRDKNENRDRFVVVGDKPRHTWVDELIGWRYLPETVIALAMLVIASICIQCARKSRAVKTNLLAGPSASC